MLLFRVVVGGLGLGGISRLLRGCMVRACLFKVSLLKVCLSFEVWVSLRSQQDIVLRLRLDPGGISLSESVLTPKIDLPFRLSPPPSCNITSQLDPLSNLNHRSKPGLPFLLNIPQRRNIASQLDFLPKLNLPPRLNRRLALTVTALSQDSALAPPLVELSFRRSGVSRHLGAGKSPAFRLDGRLSCPGRRISRQGRRRKNERRGRQSRMKRRKSNTKRTSAERQRHLKGRNYGSGITKRGSPPKVSNGRIPSTSCIQQHIHIRPGTGATPGISTRTSE